MASFSAGEDDETDPVLETEAGPSNVPITPYFANPEGHNQFPNCPSKRNEPLLQLLTDYHKRTTSRQKVRKLLLAEHGIEYSERSIGRRWQELGLGAAAKTDRQLPEGKKRQLVLDQMAKDPSRRSGPRTVKEEITRITGFHLKRTYVEDVMRTMDPDGFELRQPTATTVQLTPLTARGPHDEWNADGHDKLVSYGFGIWGVRDKFSGKWLGLWVLPNNRLGTAVAYLYLSLVRDLGGMPIQFTTDCGSEVTVIFGLSNALRDALVNAVFKKPAMRFLRSIHNIKIERGWGDLRQAWGHNIPHFWEGGSGIYIETNELHRNLTYWLWPQLMQRELDDLRERMNNRKTRKQKKKVLPSGVSANDAYTLHEDHGGQWCLQEVDVAVVEEIMREMGGEDLINDWGVPAAFSARAQVAYDSLNISELTMQNVWHVFAVMLALLDV